MSAIRNCTFRIWLSFAFVMHRPKFGPLDSDLSLFSPIVGSNQLLISIYDVGSVSLM